ncbi:MAG: xylulose kinase, partial [Candidatus Thorarchaeota archaeon]|nr:xylulose kinase [Candidatus Thorarchaeota archaeon]
MNDNTNEKKFILAIDHGTSAMKVAIADHCGDILAFEYEDTPLYLLPNGGAEQDPHEWWSALIKATNRLLSKGLVSIDD